jgi:serine/threonine protein kinase
LKPDNILLLEGNRVVIADWEYAIKFSYRKLISHNCGSLHSSPPELWNSKKYAGPEGDVWALGVLLYVMTMGYYPFQAPDDHDTIFLITQGHFQTSHEWSDDLADLIEGLLDVNIKTRYTLKDVINHNWIKYDQSPTVSRYSERGRICDKENEFSNPEVSNLDTKLLNIRTSTSKRIPLSRRLSPRSMWKALTNKRTSPSSRND